MTWKPGRGEGWQQAPPPLPPAPCRSSYQPGVFTFGCSLRAGHDGPHKSIWAGQVMESWPKPKLVVAHGPADAAYLEQRAERELERRRSERDWVEEQKRLREQRADRAVRSQQEERELEVQWREHQKDLRRRERTSHHLLHPGAWMLQAHLDVPDEDEDDYERPELAWEDMFPSERQASMSA